MLSELWNYFNAIQGGTGLTEQTKKCFRGERDHTGRWFIFLYEKDMRDSADFGDSTLGKNPGHRPPVFLADEVVALHGLDLRYFCSRCGNGDVLRAWPLSAASIPESRNAHSPTPLNLTLMTEQILSLALRETPQPT